MAKLVWAPGFELGIEEIDEEHRQIFDVVLQIEESIQRQDMARCSNLVSEFMDKIEQHFIHEESYLARIGYPDIEGHSQYHQKLLSKAQVLKKICDSEIELGRIERCYEETVNLLLDDVVRGDSEFKSFLEHKGHAKR